MNTTGQRRACAAWCGSLGLLPAMLLALWLAPAAAAADGGRLTVFAAASTTPAVKEAARRFAAETGIAVDCSFGGSGALLSQIRLEHFGDLYIPASDDFMDKAEAEALVDPATRKTLCWLTPVLCVVKGNPKQIKGLEDLGQPGLRVAMADPKAATIGAIAKAAMEAAGVYDEVRNRIVTFASDVQHSVSLLRLKEVDVAFGYDVSQRQSADTLDAVPFAGAKVIAEPVAVISFSKQKDLAQRFADYLAGPKGREIFTRHGYTVDKPQ